MSNKLTATDWHVSITPTTRGDFQTPNGIRYNVTYHNGGTRAMLEDLIAELDASADLLTPAVPVQTVTTSAAHAPTNTPGVNAPANPDGLPTQNVFGIGDLPIGSRFTHMVDRIVMGATTNGNTKGDVYPVNAKWPLGTVFAGREGANFAAIQQATGIDLSTATGAIEFNPPVPMQFEVGTKQKKDSPNYYINWVGMASADDKQPATTATTTGSETWAQDDKSRQGFIAWANKTHGMTETLLQDCFTVDDLSRLTCSKSEAMTAVAAYAKRNANSEASGDIPF